VAWKPKTMFLNGLSRRTWTLLNEAKIVFNSEPNLNSCKHVCAAINSVRIFSTNQPHLAATATKEKSASKGPLSQLRKKTGFSLANCKKALQQFDNDIDAAEKWLIEEAQKQGWEKATKLAGRDANQGLVGVLTEGSFATMVELNCETDFVARNEQFHAIVERLSVALVQQAGQRCPDGGIDKLDGEALQAIHADESGQTLKDLVALGIGNLGENMVLRRSVLMRAAEGERFATYVHARVGKDTRAHMGKFAAILRYTADGSDEAQDTIARRVCQHVVGMKPVSLGDINDEVVKREIQDDAFDIEVKEGEDEKMVSPDQLMPVVEKDSRLLFQEYILDPSRVVKEVVMDHGITLIDFVRFQCGEEIKDDPPKAAESAEQS